MKVILKADIKGVGKKGDLINASDGYARNYLFPKGLAVEATEGNVTVLKEKKESERFKKETERKNALELSKKLSGLVVKFNVKVGDGGKLFGSITSKDISQEIKKQHGFDIDKKKIELDEPIKSTGVYSVEVKVYPEISTKIKIEVAGQ